MKHLYAEDSRQHAAALFFVLLATCLSAGAQSGEVSIRTPRTFVFTRGRVLADAIRQLETVYRQPITYEDAPIEVLPSFRTFTIVNKMGPTTYSVPPDINLTVTLTEKDATPYLGANSLLASYQAAGGLSTYKAVQQTNRVDVTPTRIEQKDGGFRSVVPIMSRPVTFSYGKRNIYELAEIIAKAISSESGYKVLPLELAGLEMAEVELGATGESAANVIGAIGEKLQRLISFQCLFESHENVFYLNMYGVSQPSPPGVTTRPDGKLPRPARNGSQNGWFLQSK